MTLRYAPIGRARAERAKPVRQTGFFGRANFALQKRKKSLDISNRYICKAMLKL